jgi:hypothetical protein
MANAEEMVTNFILHWKLISIQGPLLWTLYIRFQWRFINRRHGELHFQPQCVIIDDSNRTICRLPRETFRFHHEVMNPKTQISDRCVGV